MASEKLLGTFKDGIWFIPLENADSLSSIISEISGNLFSEYAPGTPDENGISEFLSSLKSLLILDNFENVTSHASLISRLLRTCRDLKIITTSRRRLGLREEIVYDLAGMTHEDSNQLFLSAARQISRGFSPTETDDSEISDICRFLDGLPLGIELAASWIRILSCSELKAELDKGLDILQSNAHDRPERQRSIQALFEYSWDLLAGREQKALAALSVFQGGFSREAALEVSECDLKTLQKLCDHSLVRPRPGSGYTLHPLIRQFAESKQGNMQELHNNHCNYYAGYIDRVSRKMGGHQQLEALRETDLELANIKAGIVYALKERNLFRSICSKSPGRT